MLIQRTYNKNQGHWDTCEVIQSGVRLLRSWVDGSTIEEPTFLVTANGGVYLRDVSFDTAVFVARCLTGTLTK